MSSNNTFTGGPGEQDRTFAVDESGDPRAGFRRTQRRERRRRLRERRRAESREQAAAQFDEEVSSVDISESDIERVDDNTFKLTEPAVQRVVAEEFESAFAEGTNVKFDLTGADVTRVEDGADDFRLTVEAQQRLLDKGVIDLTPRDITIGPSDIEELPEGAELQVAANQLDQDIGVVDITPEDIRETPEGFELREQTQRAIAAEQLDAETGIDIGTENIERTADDSFRLTDDTQRELAATQLDEELPGADIGSEDIQQTDGGVFELAPEAERAIAAQQLDEELPETDVTAADVERTDDGFTVATEAVDTTGSEQSPEAAVAEQLDERFEGAPSLAETPTQGPAAANRPFAREMDTTADVDIDAADVSLSDGEVQLSEAVRTEIAAAQRGIAAEDLEAELAAERFNAAFAGAPTLAETPTQGAVAADRPFAREVDTRPDVDIDRTDITRTNAGLQLDEDIRREIAARQFDPQVREVDIGRGDVVLSGGRAQLRTETRREILATRFDEQVDSVDIDPGDVQFTAEGPELTPEARGEVEQAQLVEAAMDFAEGVDRSETPLPEPGEDIVFDESGDITLTDAFRREVAAAGVQASTAADLEPGEDFSVGFAETQAGVQDFGGPEEVPLVEFTPEGRREEILATAEQQGELAGIEIADADEQIEFDEQGRVADIRRPITGPVGEATEAIGGALGAAEGALDPVTEEAFGGAVALEQRLADLPFASDVGEAAVTVGTGAFATAGELREAAEPVTGPVVSASEDASSFAKDEVVPDAGEALPGTPPFFIPDVVKEQQPPKIQSDLEQTEQFFESAGRGAANTAVDLTIGLPDTLSGVADVTSASAQFVGGTIAEQGVARGLETTGDVGAGLVQEGGQRFAGALATQPAKTGGQVFGTVAGGAGVSSALSPIRIAKFRVPLDEPRTTTLPRVGVQTGRRVESDAVAGGARVSLPQFSVTGPRRVDQDFAVVRGVRIAEPRILRGRVDTPGRTIAGTVSGRPTLGTPSVRADRIDLDELEGRGATTEPGGRFETDVFRKSIQRADSDAAARFAAAEALVSQGTRVDADLELTSTEDIVRQAEEVPDEAAPAVAEAIADLDATIFGSAAIRAQVPEARTPRDVDIAVEDTVRAEARLDEALDDFDVGTEIFDIKPRAEKASPGEIVKFGRLARERLETEEGVKVTPAGEELIRKAGAAAFIRGEESPAAEFPGTTGAVDVGPEPVARGSFPRVKDPADASVIATSTLQPTGLSRLSPLARVRARRRAREIATFREEFEPEIQRATADQPPLSTTAPALSRETLAEFAKAERGQLGAGGRRGRRAAETDSGDLPDRDLDVSPSPRSPESGGFGATAFGVGIASSPAGAEPGEASVAPRPSQSPIVATDERSPAVSPVSGTDVDSPTGVTPRGGSPGVVSTVDSSDPDTDITSTTVKASADSPDVGADLEISSLTGDGDTSPSPTPNIDTDTTLATIDITTTTSRITRTPLSPGIGGGRQPDVDFDSEGDTFETAFIDEFATEIASPVATPGSVLTAEGPTDVEFSEAAARTIDEGGNLELVKAEGDLPGPVEEDLEP